METNTVLISLEKYNEIFSENINKEQKIKELEQSLEDVKEECSQIKIAIYKRVYSNNNYNLTNIKQFNFDDYHFRDIISDLQKEGYKSEKEMIEIIKKMHTQKQEELRQEEEESKDSKE